MIFIEALESRMQLSASLLSPLDATPNPPPSAPTVPPLNITSTIPANAMLPDLTPWADLQKQYLYGWQIDRNTMRGHTLLRLTAAIANAGAGPLELIGGPENPAGGQDVYQRIYSPDGTYVDHLAGTFTYHPQHHHTHFDDFATYELRAVARGGGVGPLVAGGLKTSFCLDDSDIYNTNLPNFNPYGSYDVCDGTRQGISVGWADVYDQYLPDQWIDITGVKPGQYWLQVQVDPNHHLVETTTGNNTARILINIAAATSPRNDSFSHRPNLAGTKIVLRSNNRGATIQPGEPKIGGATGGASVWWSWTAPTSGTVTISTYGSSFDTLLGVYVGDSLANLKPVAVNDDANGSMTSEVVFRAKAGASYNISVDGYNGANGSIRLSLGESRDLTTPKGRLHLIGRKTRIRLR